MVTIPRQFNGPDHSGNGGWVCGLVAEALDRPGPVTSTLHAPPPLDSPLSWEHDDDSVRLLTAGGAVIGSARPGEFTRDAMAPPTRDEVAAGAQNYPGFDHHPFDHCFTCGTARSDGDGLRIFSGALPDGRTAAPWLPHHAFTGADARVTTPVMWAALDCPGGWAADFTVNSVVLGRMTAEVYRRPAAGETCHATGRLHERDGRKFLASTAVFSADGELLGRAEQVWVLIDLANF